MSIVCPFTGQSFEGSDSANCHPSTLVFFDSLDVTVWFCCQDWSGDLLNELGGSLAVRKLENYFQEAMDEGGDAIAGFVTPHRIFRQTNGGRAIFAPDPVAFLKEAAAKSEAASGNSVDIPRPIG